MLRRNAGKADSICDGFRKRCGFHVGRGFLPLLAVMLLATPQLAFANGPTVTVNPTSLDIDETDSENSDESYTIRLDATPEEAVKVTVIGAPHNSSRVAEDVAVTSNHAGQAQVGRSLEITFAAGATGSDLAATVTVHVHPDADAVSERVTLTHTAAVGIRDAVTLANASVDVRVKDDEEDDRGVTVNPTSVTIVEAVTTPATYSVNLNTQPTGTVTVDVGGVSGEVSVYPTRLVFTPTNWVQDTGQTVRVLAGEDFDADNDTVTLTHTVSGGDYTNESADSVVVTVTDNDLDDLGITASPTTLAVAAGTSRTFTIKPNTQPKGTVKVLVPNTNSDNDQVTLNRSSVSFNSSNWNTPQTVTVRATSLAATAAQNAEPRSQALTVNLTVDSDQNNKDEMYDEETASVTINISDPLPTVSITTSRSSLTVQEDSTGEYTVRLSRNPAQDMTVFLTSPDTDTVTVNQAQLQFTANAQDGTAGTWSTPQTVVVTALRDPDAVEEAVVLEHRWVSGGPVVRMVTANVDELDTRGVTVSQTGLEVTEGESNTYSVVLESAPAGGSVTVTISSSSDDVTVRPSQLTFAAGGAAQTVTVTAIGDDDADPNDSATLSHKVRGADYDNVRVDSVRVSVREVNEHGIVIGSKMLPAMEGESGTYTVKLNSQPTGTVTVQVRSDSSELTVRPSQLKFTASDWNTEQTVRVTAEQDDDAQDEPLATLTHTASGGGYNVSEKVEVSIADDDESKIGVRAIPQALTITEGGPSSRYTMVLLTQPTGTVRVQLSVPDVEVSGNTVVVEPRIEVKPAVLTFTRNSWNVPQMVTVSAPQDDIDHDTVDAAVMHTMSGGGYDGQTATVSVTIRDNDTAGLVLAPTRLEIVQGSHQEYTVKLATEPTADVTVGVTPGGTGVTATPGSLAFTSTNWESPKTVRVQASSDATGTPTITHNVTTTDTKYTGQTASVEVEVKSSETAGVAVSPTVLEITEGESRSYTLVLTNKPEESVTINISGDEADDDITVSPKTVGFSTSNWNTERAVRVTLRDDDDASDDKVVTLEHAVTSRDTNYDEVSVSNVTVTPKDNDQRGVTVTPTSLTIAAGSSRTYRVKLNTQPTAAVRVVVNDPPQESVTVDGSPLIFTPTDWGTEQTVTVTVDAEGGTDDEQTVTLTHSVSGGDYPGEGEVPSVTVIIPVEGAPSPPRNLAAEGGDGTVTLTWSPPASDGGSAILRYEVRYRESGGSYGGWSTVSGGGNATSHAVRGLDNGTSYEFQVRAVNGVAGGQPAEAAETLAESAPGAPSGLTATDGDETVTLNWSAPEDGGSQVIRYEYRYAATGQTFSDWETVSGAGNATSVTISNLTNGTEYTFQVRAVNEIGEGSAAQASATPGRAPSMPTGLAASVESETITVMWGMPADNGGSAITGYQLRYRMNGGQWSNWMTVSGGANATSYTLTGLSNGIGHEIEVRAVNAIGSSSAASVEATPMAGIDFAHFANGTAGGVTITSDIVLVNVETSTVTAAIYFYNQMGEMIPADSVVDLMGGLEMDGDGSLTVPMGIPGRGEMTVSTNGEGALVIGSVRVFGTGRLGGVLRFDIPAVGVAGVGASEPVNDAIFPARRMARGINTGAAIRNLGAEPLKVTCSLMRGGNVMDTATGDLVGDGHISLFIDEMFPGSNTTDFVGSVRCTGADGGMFVGVALEMDAANGIFTTLPLVPLGTGSDSGDSMLNFAHFANGDFGGGVPTSSDLVFINVATSAVAPAIYFYGQDGEMIAADMVVDTTMAGVDVGSDGALMVMDEIPPMGEMTISTSGMGDGMVGSVRVVSDGPIGGVLRFDIPNIGVAGVGASEAVNAAIFPARRMATGINTGAAIRNLMADMTTVTCRLMSDGQRMGEAPIPLAGNGQSSMFINEIFPNANTDDFEGSVHCTAPSGSMFTGVALEMDFNNGIFTTLPVVPVQ